MRKAWVAEQRECENPQCKKAFIWTGEKPFQKYCCSECQYQNKLLRNRERRNGTRRSEIVRECKHCGEQFSCVGVGKGNKIYCSTRCLKEVSYQKYLKHLEVKAKNKYSDEITL